MDRVQQDNNQAYKKGLGPFYMPEKTKSMLKTSVHLMALKGSSLEKT